SRAPRSRRRRSPPRPPPLPSGPERTPPIRFTRVTMRIDVLTLFPAMFGPVLGSSILKRAAEAQRVSYHLTDIRDHTADKHGKVDDRPYGGGPGMVMRCQPLYDAVQAV